MLFYHTQTIVSRSNDAWSMQKLSKNPEIMWRKCQHLSVTSHGSDSVFIEWLAFIYLWITIFHRPTKVKLEKAPLLEAFYEKRFLKIYGNSQENTWVGVCFLIKLQSGGLQIYEKENPAQMFSCEFLQSLLRERLAETIYTKVCTWIFPNTCATGTQIMFARISTDTISSLKMHFINQYSKQTRWLWWKNRLCINGKNSVISIIPLFQIPHLS